MSANASSHGTPAADPALIEGRGAGGEPLAPNETTLPDALSEDDAPLENVTMEDMTLEDLAKATDMAVVAERRRAATQEKDSRGTQGRSAGMAQPEGCSRIHTDGGGKVREGGGGAKAFTAGGRRQGLGDERGIGRRGNSRRGAGSRRGTIQQEDDECSLYFRSDSVCEGRRVPSPSRRTSTASSGSVGGKGNRTVYLGRTQAFPLRRVESSLAVEARGFGLSGVCPEIAAGEETHLLDFE